MKLTWSLMAVTALTGSYVTAAEISGKVTLSGTPPPEKQIQFDPTCGKMHDKPVTTRHYVVGEGNGLANVFVYVKEGAKAGAAPAGKGPTLDQKGCEYNPYVMGVQAGQAFDVKNSDNLLHNVHALPKNNKEKNLAQPIPMVSAFMFDKPEVLVKFKCDVHPWMFAYVGVTDHPYQAVTDKDGNFKISGLPAGDYTIEAYHLKGGAKTEKVTVTADDKKAVNFTLEAKAAPAQ
jgi:plastocyanin